MNTMTEREKKALAGLAKAFETMPEPKRNYLTGYIECAAALAPTPPAGQQPRAGA